jgi:hypothetical protein
MIASIRSELSAPEGLKMRVVIAFALAAFSLAACGDAGKEPAPEPRAEEPAPLDPNAPAAEIAALSGCAPVSAEGYCGITWNMSPSQARAKFPVKLEDYNGDTSARPDPNACYEMFAAEPVQGVSFLVENAKVGRVDVMSEGPHTADGFGVNSEAAAIRAKYGSALTEAPNKYESEIIELTIQQGASKTVFEIQDETVRAFRSGVAPTIDYVEHCG